jgi:sulfatase maturation enzyme AslB (radical SAM superfamily)
MCGWKVWQRNKGVMSHEIFRRVLQQIKEYQIPHLAFTSAQGEPLLHPDFGWFIFEALNAGVSLVEVNTNCTPLSDKNIEILARAAKSGRFRVQASFSGYDKASHENVYVGSDFELTSRKLKKLFDAFAAIKQLSHLGINGIVLDGSESSKHYDYLRSIGIDPKIAKCHKADNFAGIVPYGRGVEMKNLRLCRILIANIVIYDNGKVSACACRDSEGTMEIGDIMIDNLITMRNGERYQSFIDAFMHRNVDSLELCRKCDIPY